MYTISLGLLFQIWTEYTERSVADQEVGNVNFLPGLGAFLQSIVYGFAGLRIRPDRLEMHNPTPPPGVSQMSLINFQYLGTKLTFTVTNSTTTISVNTTNNNTALVLSRNFTDTAQYEPLTAGSSWTLGHTLVRYQLHFT